jgi:hypothetical protein
MIRCIRLERPAAVSAGALAEALKIPGAAASLACLAAMATQQLEDAGGLALVRQPVRLDLCGWPEGGVLDLPIGPALPGFAAAVTVDGSPFTAWHKFPGGRPCLRLTCDPDDLARRDVAVIYFPGWPISDLPSDLRRAVGDQAAAILRNGGARPRHLTPKAARAVARWGRPGAGANAAKSPEGWGARAGLPCGAVEAAE